MGNLEGHNQAPEAKAEKPLNPADGTDNGRRAGLEDKYPQDLEANDRFEVNQENRAAYEEITEDLKSRGLGAACGSINDMGAHQADVTTFSKRGRDLFTIQVNKGYDVFQLDDHTGEEDVKTIYKDPDKLMKAVEDIID